MEVNRSRHTIKPAQTSFDDLTGAEMVALQTARNCCCAANLNVTLGRAASGKETDFSGAPGARGNAKDDCMIANLLGFAVCISCEGSDSGRKHSLKSCEVLT